MHIRMTEIHLHSRVKATAFCSDVIIIVTVFNGYDDWISFLCYNVKVKEAGSFCIEGATGRAC